jgi:hypothetical protein
MPRLALMSWAHNAKPDGAPPGRPAYDGLIISEVSMASTPLRANALPHAVVCPAAAKLRTPVYSRFSVALVLAPKAPDKLVGNAEPLR